MVTGVDAFVTFLQNTLADVVTVHHGLAPEIELTGPDAATGIWAMQDLLIWPDGTRLDGYGHSRETYERLDGRWVIASSHLTRLHMDFASADVPAD